MNRKNKKGIIKLLNHLVDYSVATEVSMCVSQTCLVDGMCSCSACLCCSVCSDKCLCPAASADPNLRLAQLLGFGDEEYM